MSLYAYVNISGAPLYVAGILIPVGDQVTYGSAQPELDKLLGHRLDRYIDGTKDNTSSHGGAQVTSADVLSALGIPLTSKINVSQNDVVTLASGHSEYVAGTGSLVLALQKTLPSEVFLGKQIVVNFIASHVGVVGGWGMQILLNGNVMAQWYPGTNTAQLVGSVTIGFNTDLNASVASNTGVYQAITVCQNPTYTNVVANGDSGQAQQMSNPQVSFAGPTGGVLPTVNGLVAGDTTIQVMLYPAIGDDCRVDTISVVAIPCDQDVLPTDLAIWSDSLGASQGASVSGIRGTGWAPKLRYINGRSVYNGSVGGQTAAQIAKRALADSTRRSWPTIFWMGRNDVPFQDAERVLPYVAQCVANLGHSKYIVVSLTSGFGEGVGTPVRIYTDSVNTVLASLYGDHYLDVQSLVSDSTGLRNSYQESYPSAGALSDPHMNDAGYGSVVYAAILAKLTALAF